MNYWVYFKFRIFKRWNTCYDTILCRHESSTIISWRELLPFETFLSKNRCDRLLRFTRLSVECALLFSNGSENRTERFWDPRKHALSEQPDTRFHNWLKVDKSDCIVLWKVLQSYPIMTSIVFNVALDPTLGKFHGINLPAIFRTITAMPNNLVRVGATNDTVRN